MSCALLCCATASVVCHAAAAGSGAGAEGDGTVSAALHKVVHEVLGDDLTLAEAKQMLAEVDARNAGKLSLSEVSEDRRHRRGGLEHVDVDVCCACADMRACTNGLSDAKCSMPTQDCGLCCVPRAAVQFTVMVMGHRKSEGVSSPRGVASPSSAAAALSDKAAEPAAIGRSQDDTAMVN